jgi:uncharacterized protein
MPILSSTFTGNILSKNGHFETIMPALFRKVNIHFLRQRIDLPDGDFIDTDWLTFNHKKLMVLFHGLEGSSQSQYIKGFAKYFSAHGFDVCAVNFRGCSGEPNKLLRSYHSGATEDMHQVLNAVIAANNYKSLVLGGFSLGGNMLLKYLGERTYSISSLVKAAFALSVPVDLLGASLQLNTEQNRIYTARFLKSLIQKMRLKASLFPHQINIDSIKGIKTIMDFDNRFTAPLHGFTDAKQYYQKCNSLQFLSQISLPVLLINAQNDPFLSSTCFPINEAKQHPYLFLETPKYGGHVGFSAGWPNGNYWSEQRVCAFLQDLE